jgi:hypothetical protein
MTTITKILFIKKLKRTHNGPKCNMKIVERQSTPLTYINMKMALTNTIQNPQ